MAWRIYLMPLSVVDNRRYPKYKDTHLAGLAWSAMDYGPEDTALVAVEDIPPATHTALNAEADVTAIPENLDQQVGGAITAVQNALEALNLPAGWVNANHTYRELLRIVAGIFQFIQRWHGLGGGKIFGGGVSLNTTFGSLPAGARQRLRDVADSLGYDRTGVTNSSTIREILKSMADQWGDKPIYLGDQI